VCCIYPTLCCASPLVCTIPRLLLVPTEMGGLTTMAWYGVSGGFAAAVVLLAVAFLRRRVTACDALYNDKHPSHVPGPLVLRSVDAPVHPSSASVGERRITPWLGEMPC